MSNGVSTAGSPISAEIVTTGTEILLGEIVDTNAAWIAQQLRDVGVNLYYKTTVGDNLERIQSVLELGMSRSDVLIVSGGLGPTADDVTRQAIAAATGRELRLDEEALHVLRERFARFGSVMTDNNRQQALFPEGSTLIPNPVGTAPGFIVETERSAIVAVPGVPREMKRLMEDTVLPYLRARSGYDGVIRRRVLRTVGIGESALDDMLGSLMLQSNPTVGLAAKTAQVDIRIAARAESAEAADAMIEEVAIAVRDLAGQWIYSETAGEELETVIVDLLAQRGASLAICETNTGGRLAQRIRKQNGGSAVMPIALVSDNGALPGVLSGTASESDPSRGKAVAAADIARQQAGATFGLALVGTGEREGGIFGSGSGHTWIALTSDGGRGKMETALELQYGGTEAYTIDRTVNQALSLLWRNLCNLP